MLSQSKKTFVKIANYKKQMCQSFGMHMYMYI